LIPTHHNSPTHYYVTPPWPIFLPTQFFSKKNIFSFVAFKKHVLKVRVHWKFLVCNFTFFELREEKIDDEDENNADVTFNFLNKRKKKSVKKRQRIK